MAQMIEHIAALIAGQVPERIRKVKHRAHDQLNHQQPDSSFNSIC